VNSPPPKPEVILTNFFAEPTVLLVPITSRAGVRFYISITNVNNNIPLYNLINMAKNIQAFIFNLQRNEMCVAKEKIKRVRVFFIEEVYVQCRCTV
jgi:hypothetical protein